MDATTTSTRARIGLLLVALALALLAGLHWTLGREHASTGLMPAGPTSASVREPVRLQADAVEEPVPESESRTREMTSAPAQPAIVEVPTEPNEVVDADYWELLKGQVFSQSTLRAIAGVVVRLDDLADEQYSARSDQNGCFQIWVPALDFYSLTFYGDGFALECSTRIEVEGYLVRGACGLRFYLRDGARIRGRVVDERGAPVTEGLVCAYDSNGRASLGEPRTHGDFLGSMAWKGTPSPVAYTARAPLSPTGHFEIENAIAGEPVHLLVESPTALREFQKPLELEPGEVREVVLRVETASWIEGTVELPELPDGAYFWKAGVRFQRQGERESPQYAYISDGGAYRSGPLFPHECYEVAFFLTVAGPDGPYDELYDVRTVAVPPKSAIFLDVDLSHLR